CETSSRPGTWLRRPCRGETCPGSDPRGSRRGSARRRPVVLREDDPQIILATDGAFRTVEGLLGCCERWKSKMVSSTTRKWWALGLLSVVQFMVVLDIAIVNVALPSIQTDLG